MLLCSLPREFEGEFEDPVDAAAGEDTFLDDRLVLAALENAAADARILTLGVFADDVEIDVTDLAASERRRDARHQAHRAQVGVLVELAPELEQRTP